jgi:hypothetical protein
MSDLARERESFGQNGFVWQNMGFSENFPLSTPWRCSTPFPALDQDFCPIPNVFFIISAFSLQPFP